MPYTLQPLPAAGTARPARRPAYTIEPYKDQGEYRGKLTMKEEELQTAFQREHELGWQLGLHTIGDGAIQLAVNALS